MPPAPITGSPPRHVDVAGRQARDRQGRGEPRGRGGSGHRARGARWLAGGAAWLVVGALAGCTQDPGPVPPPGPTAAGEVPLLEPTGVGAGMTVVAADPAFLESLDRLGLAPRVTGRAGLVATTGTFSFPLTGGELGVGADRDLQGVVRHEGSALLLTSGTSTVTLDDLVLDADAEVVTADVTVDGAATAEDAPVLAVDEADLQVAHRDGPDGPPVLTGLRVTLTAQGAEALNAALSPEGFAPDAPVGSVTVTVEPEAP